MSNVFFELEEEVLFNDSLMFDEDKIKDFISSFLVEKIQKCSEFERAFCFEAIIYDFFYYIGINLLKTGKTRDLGLDGIIRLNLELLGEINLGLQIKYSLIDSNDLDLFLSALKRAELQLGVLVCKDARKFNNYNLNSKLKAILLSKGIKIRERLIKENLDINPVIVLRFEDVVEIVVSNIRAVVRGVYKK